MNNCFCTILSSSYLSYALALCSSITSFDKSIQLNILLTDKKEGLKESIESNYRNCRIFFVNDVFLTEKAKAIHTKYYETDLNAFRWSAKPVFINFLLEQKGYSKVIYADCDIYFYNDFSFLWDELDKANVLLFPHWRASDPNIDFPNFEILYTSGIYNGGFICVNKKGTQAMNWWANACEFICIKDTAKGMFYDQVHLNLLPVYFEHVGIARHKGCNVANWNMVECKRSLNKDGASVIIAGEFEIIFIHFSQSTINGIENGTDPLLRPYLEQYVASVNLYNEKYKSQELIMPEVIVKKTENEKSSTLQILKKSVKRMLKK